MASSSRRILSFVAVLVVALSWPLQVGASLDGSPHLRVIPRQFLGNVFPGQSDSSGLNSDSSDAGTAFASTPAPESAASSLTSLSTPPAPESIPSLSLSSSPSSVTFSTASSSSSEDSTSTSASSSSSSSPSLSSSRSGRPGRSSSTSSSSATSSSSPSAYAPSSFSAIPLPTASPTNDQKDNSKGMGVGKGTLITICVIASIVGGIAAIWTVVRKWKLSPSRRFEKKLEDIDTDFYTPRPPSFAEKPQYYNMGHHREPSFGSATNFAGYGAAAGNVTEPPQAHGTHPGNVAAWAPQTALGRSDSGGSAGRTQVSSFNKVGYDAVKPPYHHDPYPPQAYSQGPLYPGSGKPFDNNLGLASMGGFRTGSPALPMRGPSPGYAQLPTSRAMSPGFAQATFDNGLHRNNTGASAHSEGYSNYGGIAANHLPLPGDDGGVKRTDTPGSLFHVNGANAPCASGQPPSAPHY